MAGTALSNTNLAGANMDDVKAAGALFFRTNLSHASMVRADLTAALFMEADIKSVNMTGALMNGTVDRRSFWCSTIYNDGTLRNDSCMIVTD